MKLWRFYRHMSVYLQNGRLLGRTEEIGHGNDFLNVQQGHLFVRDWYIPFSAIRDVNEQGVHLKVGLSDLTTNKWNVPAEEYLMRQGATPGYEYTTTSER